MSLFLQPIVQHKDLDTVQAKSSAISNQVVYLDRQTV